MPTLLELLTKLIRLVLKREEIYSLQGTVSGISESTLLCTFTPDEGAQLEVKLNISNTAKYKVIPKDGSRVTAIFTSPSTGYISKVDTPEKYILETDGGKFELNATETVFNNGANGGLINIKDLVTKLNNLEADVNTLKTVFSTWTPIPNDGGAALKTASASWYGSALTPTVKADIEDIKVKH